MVLRWPCVCPSVLTTVIRPSSCCPSVRLSFIRPSVRSFVRFRTITWVNIGGFSPNLVCALIWWRSVMGLLMNKFRLHFFICPPHYRGRVLSFHCFIWGKKKQGPVVQSVVSLTSSLRVISLTVLADSIYNILIFFAEKMWVAFVLQKLLTFFSAKNFSIFAYHSM